MQIVNTVRTREMVRLEDMLNLWIFISDVIDDDTINTVHHYLSRFHIWAKGR